MEKLFTLTIKKISDILNLFSLFLLIICVSMFINTQLFIELFELIESFIPSNWFILSAQQAINLYHAVSILCFVSHLFESVLIEPNGAFYFFDVAHRNMTFLILIYIFKNPINIIDTFFNVLFHYPFTLWMLYQHIYVISVIVIASTSHYFEDILHQLGFKKQLE